MSAPGAAPVLTLVPPGDPAPPAGHAQPQGLERTILRRKVRRVATVAGVTAAFTPAVLAAAAPYLDDVVVAGMVFCWAVVIPSCGLILLLAAALGRTRDDLRPLLAGIVALVLGIALVKPAGRAGMEAWASSHATELDALAEERLRLMIAGELESGGEQTPAAIANTAAFRRMGLGVGDYVKGGMRFNADAPFAPDLVYAHPTFGADGECVRMRVTPVSGRWFLYECSDPSEYDDW
ncbi:MAG TPA: hypothetical protein VFS20_05580 [Longimicrobium sp.]|nr:hypothetical protein [Longimicrobium sp.]